jgi:hypothetical protein
VLINFLLFFLKGGEALATASKLIVFRRNSVKFQFFNLNLNCLGMQYLYFPASQLVWFIFLLFPDAVVAACGSSK